MDIRKCDFEKGLIRLELITLSPDTSLDQLRELGRRAPGYVYALGDKEFTFSETLSSNGVSMRVYARFADGALSALQLSPLRDKPTAGFQPLAPRDDHLLCCRFLAPLTGCAAKSYDWGSVEAWLIPNCRDSYEGGDIYISYGKKG